jgi:branched-subunit amino acid transport protein
MTGWEALLTILGLMVITVVTRGFFLVSERELVLPDWVKRGLRYAPLAAIAAVVVPEIVMTQGHLIDTWRDARLFAVAPPPPTTSGGVAAGHHRDRHAGAGAAQARLGLVTDRFPAARWGP